MILKLIMQVIMNNVSIKDFQPCNQWKPDLDGPKWLDGSPELLVDMTTNKKYWNEDKGCVRFKCFLLILGTPVVHSIAAVVCVAARIVKLVTLSHFWRDKSSEENYSFGARVLDAGVDLKKILTQPLAAVALELSAIYGLFSPYDGRKLYASIERAQYGSFVLAPCFQPDPLYHAFGGNPAEKNAF